MYGTIVPTPEMIEGPWQARKLLEEIQNIGAIAVDTETTGLQRWKDHVVYWSMAIGNRRWCLDRAALPTFRKFLQDPDRTLIFQNVNYDRWMLKNSGVDLHTYEGKSTRKIYRCWDTAVMHCLYLDNQFHDLKYMARKLLNLEMASFRKTFGGSKKDTGKLLKQCYETDPKRVIDYASLDAWATFKIHEKLLKKLNEMETENGGTLLDYYYELEMPNHDVLWQMERHGSLINMDYLQEVIPKVEEAMYNIQREIAKLAGRIINIGSTKQLVDLWYRKGDDGNWYDRKSNEKLKSFALTSGGASGDRQPCTDKDALERRYEHGCVYAKLIRQWRDLQKSVDTYMIGMAKRCDMEGRIHTSFNQHIVKTGRLSSSDPNLQNIPAAYKDKYKIRNIFVAPDGFTIGCADYAQLEMRIVASIADEKGMIKAILEGRDQHCWNVHRMFGVPYDEAYEAKRAKDAKEDLTPRQQELCKLRDDAKTIGFGVLYGEGPWKLSADLECTLDEAKAKLAAFFDGNPAIKHLQEDIIYYGEGSGYVLTPMGRRRQLPGLQEKARSYKTWAAAKRAGVNMPIQGHAAEIVKAAQIRIYEDDYLWDAGVRMNLQVHDELCSEWPKEIAREKDAVDLWTHYMANPFGDSVAALQVPLDADLNFGPSWMHAK
jgi:DNA polymerase I